MDDIRQLFSAQRWQAYSQRLFPCQCRICQQTSPELVCKQCMGDMQAPENVCLQCGERLPNIQGAKPAFSTRCGRCISQPPAFDRTVSAYTYHQHVATLIQRFKFNEDLMLSQFLAKRVAQAILRQLPTEERPDVLIPIPLHPERLKQRGFNQSYELAKHIAKQLGIPVYKNYLIRHRPIPKQSGLNRKAREKNIKGAFRLKRLCEAKLTKLKGKHIAIVDDVITTGSTVREAARTLSRAKPGNISVMAIAKTQ